MKTAAMTVKQPVQKPNANDEKRKPSRITPPTHAEGSDTAVLKSDENFGVSGRIVNGISL